MKIICKECGWGGTTDEVLVAENPFEKREKIHGCPKCKSIESFYSACDEPDCWKEITCGTPTESGYRQTCGKHKPKEELK